MSQNVAVDCKEIAQSIKGQKPPFLCPVCLKEYKSVTGILYHIGQFGPATSVPRCLVGDDTPQGSPRPHPQATPPTSQIHPSSPSGGSVRRKGRRELTWGEAQRLVEVEFDNIYRRIEIDNDLDISMHSDEEEKPIADDVGGTSSARKGGLRTPQKRGRGASKGTNDTPSRGKLTSAATTPTTKNKGKRKSKLKSGKGEGNILLPKAEISMVESLDFPDAPSREASYYRFVEQSAEDLDETVEYDMDEEDYQWLSLINEERKSQGLTSVPQDVFEILLDRLEKECIFESHTFNEGVDNASKNIFNIDENAECCICNDGECHNTNAILFCDMCNLAVHQECYGVPYIPEGQWLCRRCIESPSRGVDCALCPNKGGAFKRTVDNRWAHVICAIWIPEVQFSNPVFLEPIDGIKEIPPARWKLTCFVCRKRMGACIQCAKANCYMAFHVTCAQQANLYMKLEATKGGEVKKTAYCDTHTPPSVKRKMEKAAREREAREKAQGKEDTQVNVEVEEEEEEEEEEEVAKEVKEEGEGAGGKNGKQETDGCGGGEGNEGNVQGEGSESDLLRPPRAVSSGVRKARKMMKEKKGYNAPVVNIPFVPQHRLDIIISRVSVLKKSQFIPKLVSYWKLKRQSRNGVPLLRRLQANKGQRATTANLTEEEREVLAEQLTLWKALRHDLERARLLIELIRKREKLKREQLRLMHTINQLQLRPLIPIMRRMLERISRKDPADIFAEAVSVDEVPDYLDVIKKPMDFNSMRKKVEENAYSSLDDFEKDFRLVWHNATIYNQKDTIYYKAAIRIKEAGQKILEQAREQIASAGVSSRTGLHDPPVEEPPPLTPSSMPTLPQLDILEVNDESMLDTFRERQPSTTSQVSLDEQIDFLQEKLLMIQSHSGYARKRKEKSLRRELSALRRQMRNERKLSETDEQQVCGSPPRRQRATSIPRNAEELASHLLHGSLRMTPSRQQILSYSGIRLEERASAMQREEQAARERMRGRGRLHSSSDSMLLMKNAAAASRLPVFSPKTPDSDDSDSGSEEDDDSETSTEQSSEGAGEEEEFVIKNHSPQKDMEMGKGGRSGNVGKKARGKKETPSVEVKADRPKSRSSSRGSNKKSAESVVRQPTPIGKKTPAGSRKGGKNDSYVEGLRKAHSIKSKKLPQRTEGEEEEEEEEEVFGFSHGGSGRLKGPDPPPSRAKSRLLQQSRRRLRSMDTISSDESEADEAHSMNGVDSSDEARPKRSSHRARRERLSPPTKGRSKSSSSVFERGRDQPHSNESDGGRRSETRKKSSCFSDSDVKGYETTPELPSASSNDDLTVKGRGWGHRLGRKRRMSASSTEDGVGGKRVRLTTSESSDGGGGVANGGMMNGGLDIKPMELVWAKCRGYPPYPALVIDPDIPPEGISVDGEKIKAPSDEVLELQTKNPTATYLVRFFDGRRTWQWLPPEKIEPLGASLEEDNGKIAMAGPSKRSVKEAYTRAKQWLRRRKSQRNSKTSKPSDADETEMSDLNVDDSRTDIYIDCNSA